MKTALCSTTLVTLLLAACSPEPTGPKPEATAPMPLGLTNLVRIEPGAFTIGSPTNEVGHSEPEGPTTRVTLTDGFWMGRHEVTQQEYLSLVGSNPSISFQGVNVGSESRPVDKVSWIDATNYCAQLTERERLAGRLPEGFAYRLPTEAEWEYACRAGTTTRFNHGDDPGYAMLTNQAWFAGNKGVAGEPSYGAKAVGQMPPNAWGLYEMHGNVSEWCQDSSLGLRTLPARPQTNPCPVELHPISTLHEPKAPSPARLVDVSSCDRHSAKRRTQRHLLHHRR